MALLLLVLAFTTACATSDKRVSELIEKARERFKAEAPEIADFTIDMEVTNLWKTDRSTLSFQMMVKEAKSRTDTRCLESEFPEPPESGFMIYYQSEPNSIVFDGGSLWYVSATDFKKVYPATGAGNRIKPEEAPQERSSPLHSLMSFLSISRPQGAETDTRWVTGLWPEWLERDSKFLGIEEVSGRPCYVLGMPSTTKTPCEKVWIDVETLHLAKVGLASAGSMSYGVTFGDWREVAPGIWLPFNEVMIGTRDGKEELVNKQRIKSVQVNNNLSDDLFNPQKIKVPDEVDRSESSE